MKSFITLLVLFHALTFRLFSQTGDTYHVQQFNTENGLPSNGIKGLQWDEQTGFLWVGTEAGVVRYNGMEFKVFGKEDDPRITNERILFVIRNNEGRIFTANNLGNFFYVKKNGLAFIENRQLFNNPNNNVVSLGVSDALYKADINFSGPVPYSPQFDKTLPLGDTASFILHAGRLFYYSLTVKTPVQVSPEPVLLTGGFKIGDNYFVREGQKSMYLFDRFSGRFTPVQIIDEEDGHRLDDIRNVFIWENGRNSPLLFNKEKAWTLNYSEGKLNAHLICGQVPENILIRYAAYSEKRKTLFIGTDSKGVIVIAANKMKSLRTKNQDPYQHSSYYSQIELPDGNILTSEGHVIGTSKGVIAKLPIEKKFSNSVFQMGDSLLWFWQTNPNLEGSYLHAYNYHTGQMRVFKKIQVTNENVITASGGKVFLANNKGIFCIEGDTLSEVYKHPADNFPRLHFDMQEIEPGVLAIATCNCLLRFDTRSHRVDTIFNAGNYCVRTMWQYNGNLFFGTYGGGLFMYRNGKVKPLPLDKNKYLLHTHCFVKDDSGYCWISTNRGLFKTSLSELLQSYDSDTSSVYYYYFGRNDGMEMTELNGGCTPCALVKKDKTISFPSMDGLLWVNPENAAPDLPEGEIFIDQFVVDGKPVNPDSVHLRKLPEYSSEIIVRTGMSAWCNKENIYLDYRLNNDKDWKPVNVEKGIELRFSNLPQGSYKLHIRKRNGFGKNNYSYKDLSFYITIPWYKQSWFYVLLALAGIGLVGLYLKFRTRQYVIRQRRLEQQVTEKTRELQEKNTVLEKNNTIKTRLISIISHDIVTPLKFLTVAGKNLLDKKQLMSEELQRETVKEIIGTSQELQLLSTNILNWIKYQNENRRMAKETFNVCEMVDQVLGILQSLARQKNLLIENSVAPALEIYQFYEPLKILVYNLLTNAIHFTEAGIIVVAASKVNGDIVISVKDGGIGMTPDQVQSIMADQVVITSVNVDNKKGHGLGYLIIKDLVKTMGASLLIESKKEAGTTVSVKMPASKVGTS